jgi:hypothetical protein
LLALIALVFSGGERVGSIERTAALLGRAHAAAQDGDAAASRAWVDQLLARLLEIPETQPVLLVAASGGGRARRCSPRSSTKNCDSRRPSSRPASKRARSPTTSC